MKGAAGRKKWGHFTKYDLNNHRVRGSFILLLNLYTLPFHGCFQEHRIAQQREVLKKERETVQKIAARAYAQQYLSGLLPSVLTSLRTSGYFHDPVERGRPSYLRAAKVSFPQSDINLAPRFLSRSPGFQISRATSCRG